MRNLRTRENGNKFNDVAKDNPQALISAIRDGDGNAFNAFYIGYGDSLIHVLTKILGNVEDAEEVMQDAFLSLWENREKLDENRSLKGYVGTTARNLAVNMIRSRYKHVESSADIQLYYNEFADDADSTFISRETEILIAHAVRRMPAQRRRVFEMSREEGLTHNEIAERLNISRNTVITHLNRAKEEIRSALISALLLIIWA